jgi:hypothetical protein
MTASSNKSYKSILVGDDENSVVDIIKHQSDLAGLMPAETILKWMTALFIYRMIHNVHT